VQLNLAARDAGRIEKVVDEPREVLRLAMNDVHRPRSLVTARLGSIEDVEAVTDRRERVSQLVREHGKEVTLPLVRFSPEIRLPFRHFSEATLALVDEVLNGVCDHEVEPRIEASKLRDPVRHALRTSLHLLRGFGGEEQAQDGHPEQPDLVDELGELERLVDTMRSVRNRGGAHSRARRPCSRHPFRELFQELGNMVPEDGVCELDDPRLTLDERLPLAHDLVARFAEEGVRRERQDLTAIPETKGHVTRPGSHPSGACWSDCLQG